MDESLKNIRAICADEDDVIANMATISCELFHDDDRFDWVGFYRNMGGDVLKIGPYQGGHGCLVIPFQRGVCGAAARTGEVQRIDDVDAFPGHIACATSTRSEIVFPVRNRDGALIAVLDIDSDQPSAFTQSDEDGMGRILEKVFANVD